MFLNRQGRQENNKDNFKSYKKYNINIYLQNIAFTEELGSAMLEENARYKVINESFPEIGERIFQLWGKPGLRGYINGLIDQARNNQNSRFTAKIESALFVLRREHDRLYDRPPAGANRHILADYEYFEMINAKYQHIGAQLKELWGGPELSEFINNMLTAPRRNGLQQGLSSDVATALFKLMAIHDQDFPEHALKAGDVWSRGDAM